jgi:hypothetical protein
MTAKSLKETLAAAGYVRLPTLYVPVEDAEMIHYIAGKHAAAVREIQKSWRGQIAMVMPTAELKRLLDAGVAHSKIADHYKVHTKSVATRARNLGYEPRPQGYRETPEVKDVL